MTLAELDRLVMALPAKAQSQLAEGPAEKGCRACDVLRTAAFVVDLGGERLCGAAKLFDWHVAGGASPDRAYVIYALAGYTAPEVEE